MICGLPTFNTQYVEWRTAILSFSIVGNLICLKIVTMKQTIFYLFLLLTLGACSSDNIPDFPPESKEVNESDKEQVKMYDVAFPLAADSAFYLKNVSQRSRTPMLNEVYLFVDYDNPDAPTQMLTLKVTDAVGKNTGELNGNVHLKLGNAGDGGVIVSDGSKSYQVTKKTHCMLTSSKSLEAQYTTKADPTPKNKEAYKPYGDHLFCSDGFTFDYGEKKPEWFSPAYYTFSIHFNVNSDEPTYYLATEKSMKTDNLVFEKLVFEMKRYTASVLVNFVMIDWEDHLLLSPTLEPVDRKIFESYLPGTTIEDWKIRPFIGNASTSFHLIENTHPVSLPTGSGIVSIADTPATFFETEVNRKDANPNTLNPLGSEKGVGVMHSNDESEVFILPMKDNGSTLFLSFYCAKPETSAKVNHVKKSFSYYPQKTLQVPFQGEKGLGVTALEPNKRYELLVVIAVFDFKRAMDKDLGFPTKSRASFHPAFGDVIEIPHRLILREIQEDETK